MAASSSSSRLFSSGETTLTAAEQSLVVDCVCEARRVENEVESPTSVDDLNAEFNSINEKLLQESIMKVGKVAKYRPLLAKLEELSRSGKPINPYQLEKEFGIEQTVITCILTGHHNAHIHGGGPGCRSALTLRGEALLGLIISLLFRKYAIALTAPEFNRVCLEIWKLENQHRNLSDEEPPPFDSHFRRRWMKRSPQFGMYPHQSASPADIRRLLVSTERNVLSALNSLKANLNRFAPHTSGGWIEAALIVCCGETDVHSVSHNRRITSVIFTCLSGAVLANSFIISGPANVHPDVSPRTLFVQNGKLIFNPTGSVEESDEHGNVGSWLMALKDFVHRTDERYGTFVQGDALESQGCERTQATRTRKDTVFVIVDDCAAHRDELAIRFLADHGYVVIFLESNLTHLIQLNDTGELNGELQKRLHEKRMIGWNEHPILEIALAETEQLIVGTFNADAIRRGAKRVGFVISDDTFQVRIDDNSIQEAVQQMKLEGRVFSDSSGPSFPTTHIGAASEEIRELTEHPENVHAYPINSDLREGLAEAFISAEIILDPSEQVRPKRPRCTSANSPQTSGVVSHVQAEASNRPSRTLDLPT